MTENKVNCNIETVGFYKKNRDRTTVPGVQPARLNEDRRLYGKLGGRNELDLELGSEGFADEGDGDIFHSFFDYLKQTHPRGSSLQDSIDADFVSNRRMIKQLAMTGHRVTDRLEIKAVRKNGVIFLHDVSPKDYTWGTPYPYGYKFEQYMTLDEKGEAHDKHMKVSNAECSKAVIRTTLSSENEKIKVIYAAELDAIDSKGRFIEMKSSGQTYLKWLRFKSLADFAQSYFGNIHSIVYGYKRSQEQVIYEVERLRLDEIRQVASEDLAGTVFAWNWDKCIEKLFAILQAIQSRLEYDDTAITVHITKEGITFEPEDDDKCDFVDPMFLRHFD